MNAIHLKYRFQTHQMFDRIMEVLAPYQDSVNKHILI